MELSRGPEEATCSYITSELETQRQGEGFKAAEQKESDSIP